MKSKKVRQKSEQKANFPAWLAYFEPGVWILYVVVGMIGLAAMPSPGGLAIFLVGVGLMLLVRWLLYAVLWLLGRTGGGWLCVLCAVLSAGIVVAGICLFFAFPAYPGLVLLAPVGGMGISGAIAFYRHFVLK